MELIWALVAKHANRLDLSVPRAFVYALAFAEYVGLIENNGRLVGKNPTSSAKGLYQYIDSAVPVAKNRLGRTIDCTDWPDDPNEMTWEQQTLLFLGDMLERKGSDKYMKKILIGDTEAMYECYLKLHHTNPDEATKERARRKLDGFIYKDS